MMDYKVLDEENRVVSATLHEWSAFLDNWPRRQVASDEVGGYGVSTVFIGVDHSFGDGPPLWFETMLFGHGKDMDRDQETHRYTTWEQAKAGHDALVKELSKGEPLPSKEPRP